MKNYKKTIIITTLVTLLPILLGVILWEKLPDSIATHWGADGQASAGQLTPRFLPLSLSIRLLQVTAAATLSPFKSFHQITPSHRRHIPVRRERRIKGAGFIFCRESSLLAVF